MTDEGRGFPRVRARHTYRARSQDEITFNAGDVLTVYDMVNDDWWEAGKDGAVGYAPSAYLEHKPYNPTSPLPDAPQQDLSATEDSEGAESGGNAQLPLSGSSQEGSPEMRKSRSAYDIPLKERPRLAQELKRFAEGGGRKEAATRASKFEFQRQHTKVTKRAPGQPKQAEPELNAVFRRRSMHSIEVEEAKRKAAQVTQETELQRRIRLLKEGQPES